ncbi:MAG: carbonic anhydrase [Bdellovibrionaceae bacterium]|nr:carbonic anhydrase [Pseudobdellovibrionaceae bacterium]MBX3034606.1 carbonic anhydrase [Pseudobdellovibrionaceae bacterium]
MASKEILRLMVGFRRFRDRYFQQENSLYQRLSSSGQTPKTLVIGCSDSRVDPALITSASPGELFVIRNVANLVPPYESAGGLHGVSSAIEFAIVNLRVENVVILGHRQCGGIRALVQGQQKRASFVGQWMQIAQAARERVFSRYPGADEETLCRHCEMESIVTSIENLKTFPFVQEALQERGMNIVGAYFDLEMGEMFEYEEAAQSFRLIEFG